MNALLILTYLKHKIYSEMYIIVYTSTSRFMLFTSIVVNCIEEGSNGYNAISLAYDRARIPFGNWFDMFSLIQDLMAFRVRRAVI